VSSITIQIKLSFQLFIHHSRARNRYIFSIDCCCVRLPSFTFIIANKNIKHSHAAAAAAFLLLLFNYRAKLVITPRDSLILNWTFGVSLATTAKKSHHWASKWRPFNWRFLKLRQELFLLLFCTLFFHFSPVLRAQLCISKKCRNRLACRTVESESSIPKWL
jgi:hypothetical protein